MKKLSGRGLPLLVSIALVFIMLTGCTKSTPKSDETTQPSAATKPSDTTQPSAAATEAPAYPMAPVTLTTIAAVNPPDIDPLINGDMANTPYNQELMKRTGVTLKYSMTTSEDFDTKLNLLIASGDVPDFFMLPSNYAGGPTKALQDGLIADLSKYLDTELPNLKKLVDAHPEYQKDLRGDNGAIYSFPSMLEKKEQTVFFGPMLRKDLLDKVGLAVPETIDEWHTVLTAFKKAGVKNPFTALNWFPYYSGAFTGAYGSNGAGQSIILGLDGKTLYGPIAPGYKDYLTTMNQWYKEGLIDPDFITLNDWGVLDTKMTSGQSAATLHFLSKINAYTEAGKKTDPNFQMVAAPNPVLKKGDKPYLGQSSTLIVGGYYVNAKSPRLHEILKYLDYSYSPEGQRLLNYGIEGESYTLDASGNPKLTELVTAPKNSKGWTQVQSMGMYTAVQQSVPTLMDYSYFQQTKIQNDFQRDAITQWSKATTSTFFPSVTPNEAETQTIKKLADVETYVSEMTAKFILGSEPIANFDKYVERIKSMGIDNIVAAYQSSLDRYNKR